MKKAKKLLAMLLAIAIATSGMVLNTATVSAADPTGVLATVYNIPSYVHDVMEETGWNPTISLEFNDQFDETIDQLLAVSREVGVPKPGITVFPYIAVNGGTDDYYIREWKGTMEIHKTGTYTMVGNAIDNGFVMRIKGEGDPEFRTVYEYWGASHWFPQYPILGPVPYEDGTFYAEAGDTFEVEMYYLELDYGEVLELAVNCEFEEQDAATGEMYSVNETIKLYDDPIYNTDEEREANKQLREETFSFSLTEKYYADIADASYLNQLIGMGHGANGEGQGGNGAQCIEENFKFQESIGSLLSLAIPGETKRATSFATSLTSTKCDHCDYNGDSYVVLYEGTLEVRQTGYYRMGAYSVDDGFYMEIDAGSGYQTVYELWAGNTWNAEEKDADGNTITYGAQYPLGNQYTEGIYLKVGQKYKFRAALFEITGNQNISLFVQYNQTSPSWSSNTTKIAIANAFRFYATDLEDGGSEYPYAPPEEEVAGPAPKLEETTNEILYYTDFSGDDSQSQVVLKQIGDGSLADPATDAVGEITRGDDGYPVLAENEYIDMSDILATMKGKSNVSIEFVVKPEKLFRHGAFAGIGDANTEDPNWVVMGFHENGAVKYGMQSNGVPQAGEEDAGRSAGGQLAVGTWAIVKYEFTASTVTMYVNGDFVHQLNIQTQKNIGDIGGGFIFGKELHFNDGGFEGSVSEIRVSSFTSLGSTDNQVLYYTDFSNTEKLIVKESAGLPNPASDSDVALELDDDNHMVMTADQYIDLDFDLIKGKNNVTVEFVVKPSSIGNMTFAGIGDTDCWITMDMKETGAAQFGIQTGGAVADIVAGSSLLKQEQWVAVKYEITPTYVNIYVNEILVATKSYSDGNALHQIAEGGFVFGKALNAETAGFAGTISEIRVSTFPALGAVEGDILYYTDFSNEDSFVLKEAIGEPNDRGLIVPNTKTDALVTEPSYDEYGNLVMTEQQYIDIGLDKIGERNNVSIEFIINPSKLSDHRALAGIGSDAANDYIVMGMMGSGALKYGMKTNVIYGEVGEGLFSAEALLSPGTWTKVKYEFTAFKVKLYVNDVLEKEWAVNNQRTLSQMTGGFIFGKELHFGDAGFVGAISELRVSAVKSLDATENQELYHTDFSDISDLELKEVVGDLPAPKTDNDAVPGLDEYTNLLLDENQYIDLGVVLGGMKTATIDFIIKPTELSKSTLVGVGNTSEWLALNMTATGALQFEMNAGGIAPITKTSEAGLLQEGRWTVVKCEIKQSEVRIYVENELKLVIPVENGNALGNIVTGQALFGKAVHTNAIAGYAGYVSEIRGSTLPVLGETDNAVLFYTDFSEDSDKVVVKEATKLNSDNKVYADPATDNEVDIALNDNGSITLTENQYIDIGLDELEGNDRIFLEFVVKPSALVEHAAFAGIMTDNDNWLVAGMRWDGALKYGMASNGLANEVGKEDPSAPWLLNAGQWAKVQYEISPDFVKAYINDELVKEWSVLEGHKTLSQFTTGNFIFGKELRWADAGFEGTVSEIRISTFKSLDATDNQVLFYTNFKDDSPLSVKESKEDIPNLDTDKTVTPVYDGHNHLQLADNQYIALEVDAVTVANNATIEFFVKPTVICESAITGVGNGQKWVSIGMDANGYVTYSINVGNEEISGVSATSPFKKDYWTLVKYEITETTIKVYVEGELVATASATDGKILEDIIEGGVVLGKELKLGTPGFTGLMSELRISTLPTLADVNPKEEKVLFYTDFSDASDEAIVKEAVKGGDGKSLPNPATDKQVTVTLDENGHMIMAENQYIDLGLDMLSNKKDVIVEFVIKPDALGNHYAFAGLGSGEDNWIVMGMMESGSVKFGMDTSTSAGEICGGQYSAEGLLAVGKWVKVKYVFTESTVTAYVNDALAKQWSVSSGQKTLDQLTGNFVFGKETKWGDFGLSGTVSELRVSTTDTFPFVDVAEDQWYYDTIKEAYELGLMYGANATEFKPNVPMTRGMMAVVLWRMSGSPQVEFERLFPDVVYDQYYSIAVTWAAKNHVVNGYNSGRFAPNDNVTREQVATMLCNYAKFVDKYEAGTEGVLDRFNDAQKVSSYAKESMQWAVTNGLLTGKDEGTRLDPQGIATRAECTKMLLQLYKVLKNN